MMKSRRISELKWARYASCPWHGRRRLRGKKAAGLRYEKLLGEELARRGLHFVRGPWIEFFDSNGRGFAQPDFVVFGEGDDWLVLEAKLSQTQAAFAQLFDLYVPLLAHLHPEQEFVPLQVCKYLREPGPIIEDLSAAKPGAIWHWLG